MRFRAALAAFSAIAACAHGAPREARWEEGDRSGAVAIVLRHGPDDDAVAVQVRRALRAAIPVAERWGALHGPLVVTIHPTHEALEAAAASPDHPWLRAWARADGVELQSPRTWSRGTATDEQLTLILAHELTHCAMFQAVGDARLGLGIPPWFREGMAAANAGEDFAGVEAAVGGLAAAPPAGEADATRAYATADRAFRFLVGAHGARPVRDLLARMREGAGFADAFREAMGVSVETFEAEFTASLQRAPDRS